MNTKVTFHELSAKLASQTGISTESASDFIKCFFDLISDALLRGESVKVKGLGTFNISKIDGENTIDFSVDKNFADSINSPFSIFEAVNLTPDVTDRMISEVDYNDREETQSNDSASDNLPLLTPAAENTDDRDYSGEISSTGSMDDSQNTHDSSVTAAGDVAPEPSENEVAPSDDVPPSEYEETTGSISEVGEEKHSDEEIDDNQDDISEPTPSDEASTHDDSVVSLTSDNNNNFSPDLLEEENEKDNTDSEPETENKTDSESDPEPDSDSESGTNSESESEQEPEPESDSQHIISEDSVATLPPVNSGLNFDPLEEEPEEFVTHRDLPRQKSKFGLGLLIGLIVGIAIGACALFFAIDYLYPNLKQNEPLGSLTEDSVEATGDTDSLLSYPAEDIDSTEVQGDLVGEPQSESQAEEAIALPVKPVETLDTVRTGYTLNQMAKKHYGSKDFWCYIYEENKAKIKNPNAIGPGVVLVIPAPDKFGIDPNSKESIQKAKELSGKILSKYQK